MTNEEFIKNLKTEELARVLKYAIDCWHCPIHAFCDKTECEGCEETWIRWLKAKKTAEDLNYD